MFPSWQVSGSVLLACLGCLLHLGPPSSLHLVLPELYAELSAQSWLTVLHLKRIAV